MNDFDFDVMQKKRIAQSARHRVCGSKSRKCSLPSDSLTPAQRRKLNGPVSAWNLNAPMSWEEFKQMPEDLQKDYLTGIHARFHVGPARLEELFGVHNVTVYRYLSQNGLKGLMGTRSYPTREQAAEWKKFCAGETVADEQDIPEEQVVDEPVSEQKKQRPGLTLSDLPALLCGGTVRMEGSARELLPSLVSLLNGHDAHMSVSFCFTPDKEEHKIENLSDE